MVNQTSFIPRGKKTVWAWVTATFFGAGLLKPGPGTYGSCAAVLLWDAAAHTIHPTHLPVWTALAATVVTLVGIPAATIVARESHTEDPGHVVIDEVAGQLIALIALPPTWQSAALALLLFRLFDILKPPPIRQLERLPEGTGIMLDDVAAGLLALAAAHLLRLIHLSLSKNYETPLQFRHPKSRYPSYHAHTPTRSHARG